MNNLRATKTTNTFGSIQMNGCGPLLSDVLPETKGLRQLVFEYIRTKGRAARADVARTLNISAGSVTAITADLIAANLLREVEGVKQTSGRGRPRVAIEVVPDSHHVIGIKLSDRRHTAVLTDFTGNILAESTLQTLMARKSPEQLLDEVDQLIARLLSTAEMTLENVDALGVGLSGIVDYQTSKVVWSPFLTAPNIDLKSGCEARFGIPAHIDNDANVLTQAELWFGNGRDVSDFAVVTIEHGVGMGLVLNNRLFRGSRGMGLELGHTKVQLDGALCRCGQRGCLEAYLADYALTREAATALGVAPSSLQGSQAILEALFAEAKAGNTAAQTIFHRAGRYLSVGLSNVMQLFDPALIVLSGERTKYEYLYADEILAEMRALNFSDGRDPCRIEIKSWEDHVWAHGATVDALSALTDTVLGEIRG